MKNEAAKDGAAQYEEANHAAAKHASVKHGSVLYAQAKNRALKYGEAQHAAVKYGQVVDSVWASKAELWSSAAWWSKPCSSEVWASDVRASEA